MLFTFKGITGAQFKTAVQASKTYEDVGAWLLANGTSKTPAEIKTWSDEVEAGSPMKNPEKRECFVKNCSKLGLNPETSTTFDWLEADDRASFGQIPLKELKANAASTGKEEDLQNVQNRERYFSKSTAGDKRHFEPTIGVGRRSANANEAGALECQRPELHRTARTLRQDCRGGRVLRRSDRRAHCPTRRHRRRNGSRIGRPLPTRRIPTGGRRRHVSYQRGRHGPFDLWTRGRGTITEADDLDDADTADLFTEVSRGIDKWLWFVEAHTQATE